jgi:diguanylate cyclase (GGDEF)-like protein
VKAIWRIWLAAFLLPAVWAWPAAADVPLRTAWQAGQVSEPPAEAGYEAFDPALVRAFPRNPDGVWIRLQPRSGWPQGPLVVVVRTPPMGPATLFAPGAAPQRAALDDLDPDRWHGHGRLAFPLLQPLPARASLLLHFEPYPSLFNPVTVAVMSMAEYEADDARWLTFASICFTTMAAMALIALLFAVRLGDISFWYYSGYLLCFALLQSVQSGFVFHPLGASWVALAPLLWGRVATGLSVMFATLFLASFAELRHYTPRLCRATLAVGWVLGAVTVLGVLPLKQTQDLARMLANPLLLLGALVLLVASSAALLRGSRYAGFFLLGWAPLLVVTALGSAQSSTTFASWTWLNDADLAAGAFEALMLSLGLADRMLAVRRERDRARSLAELDPLTNLLNRRAWTAGAERVASTGAVIRQPAAALFIDLDHFKSLNDQYGHEAGDHALVAVAACLNEVLRPGDVIGRYGGEEFVVALPRCTEERALGVAERLRAGVQALAIPTGHGPLTASIGVAILKPGEALRGVLARADRAMYQAKSGGRNRVMADRVGASQHEGRPELLRSRA